MYNEVDTDSCTTPICVLEWSWYDSLQVTFRDIDSTQTFQTDDVCSSVNLQEVTTLGQPLEVLKTQMAANRSQTMLQAFRTVASRGGVAGFYQGLIPWAWIEASTKGGVLMFAAGEIEGVAKSKFGASDAVAGLFGGMGGGIAQAYATMGELDS